LAAFLSIKPSIPLSQELEQVLVLVGQIEPHETFMTCEWSGMAVLKYRKIVVSKIVRALA
jgi:hypothetical protein